MKKTLFGIGSTSKAFTAALLAMAVDENKVAFESRITSILTDYKFNDSRATGMATFRDLVGHKMGIPRYDILSFSNANITRKQAVYSVQYYPPNIEFRSSFQYINWMFVLTGYTLETLYKTSWESLLQTKLLNPLGMSYTTPDVYQAIGTGNYAFPLINYNGTLVALPKDINHLITLAGPAGSISSNAVDMAKWMKLHLNKGKVGDKQIISASNLALNHIPQTTILYSNIYKPTFPISLASFGYAMGWIEAIYNNHRISWHNGVTFGHVTLVWLFPFDNVGIFMSSVGDISRLNLFETLVFMYASDLIFGTQPWLTPSNACTYPCTFIPCEQPIISTSKQVKEIKYKASRPLSEYAGIHYHLGLGQFIVSVIGNTLRFKYNDMIGTLQPNGQIDQFKLLFEGFYEIYLDSAHNNFPPVVFTTNAGAIINSAIIKAFEELSPPQFFKQ